MNTIQRAAARVIDAWDSTVLPVANDGRLQEAMEDLRAVSEAAMATPTLREAAQQALAMLERTHHATDADRIAAADNLRAALAEQPADQAEPPYGATDFGFTFAGIDLEDGDRRLMAMLVTALGTEHPAIDDMVALLFRARKPAPAAEQAEPVAWQPLKTTAQGRAAVATFFRDALKRHDFDTYISTALAADFACVLGGYLTAPPAPARQEPLFLLHTGQIDSGGEQDEWDIEANSWVSVEEFCRAHPGQTIGLHPQPLPAAPITAAPAEGGAA